MSAITTRALLLRSHPYSETSRVLRFLTADRGLVGVMARGVRRKGSKGGSGLETFAGGHLTIYIKEGRDLQTYKDFTATHPRRGLGRNVLRFAAASVVGEIVLRHGGVAPSALLFDLCSEALDRIEETEDSRIVPVLLAHGWSLVRALGYEPVLDRCVHCGEAVRDERLVRFDFTEGGVRCLACAASVTGPRLGPGAREQLTTFLAGREGPATRPRAHLRLLSDFITYHLEGSRPLDSIRLLAGLLPRERR